jgi:hypothetical protein
MLEARIVHIATRTLQCTRVLVSSLVTTTTRADNNRTPPSRITNLCRAWQYDQPVPSQTAVEYARHCVSMVAMTFRPESKPGILESRQEATAI